MTNLKICGIRSKQDYELVVDSHAHYAGFVFAESKRQVTPEEVGQWLKNNNGRHAQNTVGVFVNPDLEALKKTLHTVNLDVVQLHGNEDKSFIHELRSQSQVEVWKALPHTEQTEKQMRHYLGLVDGFIIDTKVKGLWGGTGKRFDWSSIPSYTKLALKFRKRCFIAGGITPENVTECLTYSPEGIDLSSGVEQNEQKNPYLIKQLLERMNNYENNLSR